MPKNNGTCTVYQRGNIWWVQVYVDGKPIIRSSKSNKKAEAVKLRNRLLARKERGEIFSGAPDQVLIGELLDDLLRTDIKDSTRYIWKRLVEKTIRLVREAQGAATDD